MASTSFAEKPRVTVSDLKMQLYRVVLFAIPAAINFIGCGGNGSPAPPLPPPNPVPSISAISPNSSEQGGQGFTLSVVGSNFIPGVAIHWNGGVLQTTIINNLLVTADLPAGELTALGPDTVTVVNPAPGGGTSNSLEFAVPCVIPPPSPDSRTSIGGPIEPSLRARRPFPTPVLAIPLL